MVHCNTSRTGGRVHTIYKASRIPPAPAARAVARCDRRSGGRVERDASRQITFDFASNDRASASRSERRVRARVKRRPVGFLRSLMQSLEYGARAHKMRSSFAHMCGRCMRWPARRGWVLPEPCHTSPHDDDDRVSSTRNR